MGRYQSRLLAFCRHMLGSREDAEDVLQEVFAAAFNAMQADERPLNVRPWLYRIARNRSLNHLRRVQPIGVDSMDVHFSENGLTTADKVHGREDFRLLLSDVQGLPETQRTALLLREIDALSYEQIAEAMDTTVPSVKSLLVRARVALAEAAEARQLSCDEVRLELGEVAEGLVKLSPPVRRHLKQCDRCASFKRQLRDTNKALAAIFPVGPIIALKHLIAVHLGGSTAGGGAGAASTAVGTAAGTAAAGGAASGLLSAGAGAVGSKAAAGLAAAAIVGVGAVEVRQVTHEPAAVKPVARELAHVPATGGTPAPDRPRPVAPARKPAPKPAVKALAVAPAATTPAPAPAEPAATTPAPAPAPETETVTDTTVLPSQPPPTTTPAQPAPAAMPAPEENGKAQPQGSSPPPASGEERAEPAPAEGEPPPPPPQQ